MLLVLLLCSFIGVLGRSSPYMVKDGRLDGLVHILNSHESQKLFSNWKGSVNESMSFLSLLEPWVLLDNNTPLRSRSAYNDMPLQCENELYSNSLTGKPLSQDRLIVDFVPFGYDVDKLLVRFYETAKYVDVFVIYEMPYTLLGHPKSLFFDRIRHQSRFKEFENKIIYLNPDMTEMQNAISMTQSSINRYFDLHKLKRGGSEEKNSLKVGSLGQRGSSSYLEPALYSVMRFFNEDLMRQFNRIGTFLEKSPQEKNNAALKEALLKHIKTGGSVYAIQNDGDEFVKGEVLRHIRHCELKPGVTSIFTPCFGFKNNYHWLQTTLDMRGFTSGQVTKYGLSDVYKYLKVAIFGHFSGNGLQMELNKFIWRLGPFLWPLETVMESGQLLRRNFTQDKFFNNHMGYGAATHMSAVNDPAELWYKACGTVEMLEACGNIVPFPIRDAAARGQVTAQLIYDHTVFPWCHLENKGVHVKTLTKKAQKVVMDSIPWVVKNNPAAFPFMYPVPGLKSSGYFEQAAKKEWVHACGSDQSQKDVPTWVL
jgi:hypothetical protein